MKKKAMYRKAFLRWLGIGIAALFALHSSQANSLAPDARGTNEVRITANGYEPATLTVSVGATVTWINKDDQYRIVDSGAPNRPAALFSSPGLRLNSRFSHKFDSTGTFDYYCARTLATGKIIVIE